MELHVVNNQDTQIIFSKVESILKSVVSNYAKWELAQERGLSLCRTIEARKTKCLQNSEHDPYPPELELFSSKLKRILEIFNDILSDTEESYRNLEALGKLLKKTDVPLFGFGTAVNFLSYLNSIKEKYYSEIKIKQKVIENISHCTSRSELIYYTSIWQYPLHANDELKLTIAFIIKELMYKKSK